MLLKLLVRTLLFCLFWGATIACFLFTMSSSLRLISLYYTFTKSHLLLMCFNIIRLFYISLKSLQVPLMSEEDLSRLNLWLKLKLIFFLLHLNILHYYKQHPQKCKPNYHGPYCQMPVKYLKNLARLFLSKNSHLNHFAQKKTHWKKS